MQSEVITFKVICCHSHTNVELIFVHSMQRYNSEASHSPCMKEKSKHFVLCVVECIVMYCIDSYISRYTSWLLVEEALQRFKISPDTYSDSSTTFSFILQLSGRFRMFEGQGRKTKKEVTISCIRWHQSAESRDIFIGQLLFNIQSNYSHFILLNKSSKLFLKVQNVTIFHQLKLQTVANYSCR